MKNMKNMKTRLAGKNLLFAELIVVILFFSLAAAACVTLFGEAYRDSQHSRDLTNAVIMAQNAAEVFKATGDIPLALNQSDGLDMVYEISESGSQAEIVIYKDTKVVYMIRVAVPVLEEGEGI